MSGVFISYRRGDSQQLAGRLFDRLVLRFGKGRVFRDIDAIDPGANFAEVIGKRISECAVLVALIGKGWIGAQDAEGRRRLDLPDDLVKMEIAEALAQGKVVIPALIEDTPVPSVDALPPELAALARCNALPLSDARFDFDVGRLTGEIEKAIPPDAPNLRDLITRFWWVGLLLLSGVGLWWQWGHITKLPGVEPVNARITKPAPPTAATTASPTTLSTPSATASDTCATAVAGTIFAGGSVAIGGCEPNASARR